MSSASFRRLVKVVVVGAIAREPDEIDHRQRPPHGLLEEAAFAKRSEIDRGETEARQ